MLARVRSAAVLGIDAYLVDVETDIANGLPTFATVGLPQGAVKEGRERVYSAIANSGYTFPLKRITVNLAPADIRKEGSAFDLPIALGVLAATGQVGGERLGGVAVLGELSLEGAIRPGRGALPAALPARGAGLEALLLPKENLAEVGAERDLPVLGVATLVEPDDFLDGDGDPPRAAAVSLPASPDQRRGVDRRRLLPAPRRGESRARRRAVPRRAARVPQERARGAAPADGGRGSDHRTRGDELELPGALHAGGGDEPLPVRVPRRSAARVLLRPNRRAALSRARLGAPPRPHRHSPRGPRREVPGVGRSGRRRAQRSGARARGPGAGRATRAVRRARGRVRQRAHGAARHPPLLPRDRRRRRLTPHGDQSPRPLGPRLSPYSQDCAHHRRPGRGCGSPAQARE